MEKKMLSARPPNVTDDLERRFIDDGIVFIQAITDAERKKFPWQSTTVREDVMKVFNVRLSEPYFLKLKYISEQSRESINAICTKLIKDYLDKQVY